MKKIILIASILLSFTFIITACKNNDNKTTTEQLAKNEMYTCTMHNDNKPLYVDYCPMANKNKGAYWLSQIKEIQNPYQGQKMPRCGEIKKVL